MCNNMAYNEPEELTGTIRCNEASLMERSSNTRVNEALMYEEPVITIPDLNNVQNPAYGVTPTSVESQGFHNPKGVKINVYDTPFMIPGTSSNSAGDVVMQTNSAYK